MGCLGCCQKGIDRIPQGISACDFSGRDFRDRDCGDRWAARGLKGPVAAWVEFRLFGVGRDGTLFDPAGDITDLIGGEWFPFWRHSLCGIRRPNSLDQGTSGFSHGHDFAILAAVSDQAAGIESQARLLFETAMTRVTAGFQQRLDVAEVIDRIGHGFCVCCNRNQLKQQQGTW